MTKGTRILLSLGTLAGLWFVLWPTWRTDADRNVSLYSRNFLLNPTHQIVNTSIAWDRLVVSLTAVSMIVGCAIILLPVYNESRGKGRWAWKIGVALLILIAVAALVDSIWSIT